MNDALCELLGRSQTQLLRQPLWDLVHQADRESERDAVRRLLGSFALTGDAGEQERHVPRPLFEALRDAGVFRMSVPTAVGGAEVEWWTPGRASSTSRSRSPARTPACSTGRATTAR